MADTTGKAKTKPGTAQPFLTDAKTLPALPLAIEHSHVCEELPAPLLIDALEIGMLEQAHGARKRHPRAARRTWHSAHCDYQTISMNFLSGMVEVGCKVIRGIRASPKPACGPSHADGKAPWRRSWSSCACENRASSSAYAGWVGMCAWA